MQELRSAFRPFSFFLFLFWYPFVREPLRQCRATTDDRLGGARFPYREGWKANAARGKESEQDIWGSVVTI